MKSKKTTILAAVALAWGALAWSHYSVTQAQQSTTVNTVTGITKPSVHSKLGLYQIGIIRDLPVKEGQHVKKGELLLQQDIRQEEAELEALKLEADSDVEIRATDADRQVKKVQLKRVEELAAKGSSTPSELEEAQVKVVYADAQVDLAKLKQQTKKLEAKKQEYKIDQMRLTSPVDGIVEMIDVSVGEITDPQKPVMTVVQNDPLWVEFFLPTAQSVKLKVGQTMEVKYDGQSAWLPATLIYRAPVADASSAMQKMHLELKNPNSVDAGLQLQVKLPPELGTASTAEPGTALLPAPQQ